MHKKKIRAEAMELVGVRLPASMIEALDKMAETISKERGDKPHTRADSIRILLVEALRSRGVSL